VNTLQELTLESGESVSGRVYCTDEMTGTIVLQAALVHTTLATDMRIVAAASVRQSVQLPEQEEEEGGGETTDTADRRSNSSSAATTKVAPVTPLSQPLPKIQKKALEERERRALKLAEDSLRHLNQKVGSPARRKRNVPNECGEKECSGYPS
jgi:hypothetical protein